MLVKPCHSNSKMLLRGLHTVCSEMGPCYSYLQTVNMRQELTVSKICFYENIQ